MSIGLFDFFLESREPAQLARTCDVPALTDSHLLLGELRLVFDWIGGQKNCERIPRRVFKKKLPEIHAKFPQLAANFSAMDTNHNYHLEWTEFVDFCLKDERFAESLKRATDLQVYSVDIDGNKLSKATFDPVHACELGSQTEMLPWEVRHVVEWRVRGLTWTRRGVMQWGRLLQPGDYISSPSFAAAGVRGCLRFWPAGYFNEAQRQQKNRRPARLATEELAAKTPGGLHALQPMPNVNAWCCLGASLPEGTHLDIRFFVADARSEKRECYWRQAVHAAQLWAPVEKTPPKEVLEQTEADHITVGIEIFRNVNGPHRASKPQRLSQTQRWSRRPALKQRGGAKPCSSFILNRTAKVPTPVGAREHQPGMTLPDLSVGFRTHPASFDNSAAGGDTHDVWSRAARVTQVIEPTFKTSISETKPLLYAFSLPSLR
eukprot:TRINITY_DN45893_c0_g1_i1.p1 TRINITY_DN45893_c0_g1~~TRINITY_DN45893_c0_g1_i1.p1  ORF type:complete len:433 (-),score=66.03 TRINITY_DN45893_c0_g1_i1:39-1337(-)